MSFGDATAIQPAGEGAFACELSPDWTIGGKPNGGYLLAILGRAVVAVGAQPHVLAASAHYLRPPDPGPALVRVVALRTGRTASQLQATLEQDGRPSVVALFTVGTLDPAALPFWSAGMPRASVAPFDDCFRIEGTTPTGLSLAIMDQVELVIQPADLAFGLGKPRGRGELNGWLQLIDEDHDPLSLLYAVDSFPPATLDVVTTGWVPTLELTAYVRALPAPGPVQIRHTAQLIDDGRVDEVALVWDSTGRLVAQCTQLAGIRLPDAG